MSSIQQATIELFNKTHLPRILEQDGSSLGNHVKSWENGSSTNRSVHRGYHHVEGSADILLETEKVGEGYQVAR